MPVYHQTCFKLNIVFPAKLVIKRTGNTFRGHPCRRVHPSGTLEGEFSICHAYSGCQVLINLCTDHHVINITQCHKNNCLLLSLQKLKCQRLQGVRRRI